MADVSVRESVGSCAGRISRPGQWKHFGQLLEDHLHSDQTCGCEAAMSSEPSRAGRSCRLQSMWFMGEHPQTWQWLGPGAAQGRGAPARAEGWVLPSPAPAALSMPVSDSQAPASPSV